MSRLVMLTVTARRSGAVDFVMSAGEPGAERVRVVRSRFGPFACMTHNTADTCAHSATARRHYATYGASLDGAETINDAA